MEADTFARHQGIPGHDQEALSKARIVLVGAGGLNSWGGGAWPEGECKKLTIIDRDTVERTNTPRQLYYGEDLGKNKVITMAVNLVPHMMAGGHVTGISLTFQEAVEKELFQADLLVVGVDNNDCRLAESL